MRRVFAEYLVYGDIVNRASKRVYKTFTTYLYIYIADAFVQNDIKVMRIAHV